MIRPFGLFLVIFWLCGSTAMAQTPGADSGAKPKALDAKPGTDEAGTWKKLIGQWQPSGGVIAGKPMPDDLKSIKLQIRDDKSYVVDFGGLQDKGTINLDLSKEPMVMMLNGIEGPNANKNIPTIFKFEGSKLIVCYDLDRNEPPNTFESPSGSAVAIITYEPALSAPKVPAKNRP